MANSFWNFATRFTAGTLAKAEDVNTNYSGVEAGFDSVETEIDKCIQLTNLGAASVDITQNAAARALKIVSFDASGNVVAVVNIGSWQGDWAAQDYVVRDLVKDAAGDVGLNNIYMCNTAHTGTDLSTQIANWDLVIDLTDVVTSETNAATSETNAAASAAAAAASAASINFASGTFTTASLAVGVEEESGDIAHGLGTDDIDFGFKVTGSVSGGLFADVGIKDANDYVVTQVTNLAVNSITTPAAGNINIGVTQRAGAAQTITVHWWARSR
jgi:hypothetical protein